MSGTPRRHVRLMTLRGIPVFVNVSVFVAAAAIFIALLPDVLHALAILAGYFFLIALHEAGHAAAARSLGLRVHSVKVSATGGICLMERPRRVRDSVLVYSAGIGAQFALLLLTLIAAALWGQPASAAGGSLYVYFTLVNAGLIVLNLIPFSLGESLQSDGRVLWQLFAHRFFGRPHPHPPLTVATPDNSPVFAPETTLLSVPGFLTPDFTCGIEILNDRTTPMILVMELLQHHLSLGKQQALALMLKIHNDGGVLHPLPDAAGAERAASAISEGARKEGHTLTCRAVTVQKTLP